MKSIIITGGINAANVKITDEAGKAIFGIREIDIHISPNAVNTAKVTMATSVKEVKAISTYHMIHPVTGVLAEIDSITFADGSVWDADSSAIQESKPSED